MDKLIAELLDIERTANESLAEFKEECADHSGQIEAEVNRCVQGIKRKADQEVEVLKYENEAVTQVKLAEIENEYQQKALQLKKLFADNIDIWRKGWTSRVLDIDNAS